MAATGDKAIAITGIANQAANYIEVKNTNDMMTLDKDGTLEAVALTDGTATITNGAISSVTTLTATTLTDGTASITGGKYTQRWRQQAGGYKLELSRV